MKSEKTPVLGLASKIALTTAMALAIATVFTTGVQLWLFKKNLEETVHANQSKLTSSIADNLDQQLITLKNALISSAKAVTEHDVASSDAAQKYLDNNAGLNAIFERSVFLFSPEGRLIAERPFLPDRRGQDFSWRDYNREAIRTRGPVISEPFVTTKGDRNVVIMFATPVFSKDGSQIIATNTGSFGLTNPRLLGGVANMKLGKSGHMYIVTDDGKLVMHPDRSRLLQRAYQPQQNPMFEKALQGLEGTVRMKEPDGQVNITSFKKIPTTGWLLVSVLPEKEAFESFDKLLRNLSIVFLFSVLLTTGFVWFHSRGLVAKIQSKNRILKKLKAQSLRQLKTKTQFFNEASHDFRQRLHGMQLLVNSAERSGSAAHLPKISGALADLQRYLTNLLEITRLETISVQPQLAELMLQDVFHHLELQFEDSAIHRKVQLDFHFTALTVFTDKNLLLKILENLISNAIKFSNGKVLIAARSRSHHDEIIVMDNGRGLLSEERADLSAAFVRSKTSRSDGMDAGFGLGLSIVKRSAHILGATVKLRSTPGRGTRFTVVLPRCAESSPEPDSSLFDEHPRAEASAPRVPGKSADFSQTVREGPRPALGVG